MKVWFGGYTSHDSKGIYQGQVKTTDSDIKIENVENVIQTGKPTYFQINDDLIFTIAQEGDDKAGIASYSKDFKQLDSYMHPGAAPCYIGINNDKKLLYTANYHLATLNVFSFDNDGKISLVASTKHEGSGPRPEQDAAHPHFFDETPAGNLVSCDLGTDSVDFYKLVDNKLVHLASYQMEKGFGTRHITFAPDGTTMYIVGELSSQVNVARLDEDSWKFEDLGTYKTIADDFEGHNGAAAIRLSNDGKFLYISNRGDDSLVAFKVLDNQKLEKVQRISVFGSFPRDFNWDESQQYLVAANQNTNNATLYRRNSENGTLTPIQKNISAPEATRVLFTKD
ncbi:6-phosphogluconolactonase [Lactobacillus colini]|uniref:6-phosphogluconolactonase n=1 Tax=Lactobacillus colini TaxID=1819254 RepID=A0ABS4MD67_9LACO|nr:lactonase family protein [Lactobacillus colini]MBP2057637.1 6-phosphogluconolactonase [Lactobacillus colini]